MWMSIAGMYEYDNSLFDGLDIPSYTDEDHNTHVIDKTTVINNIILKCAELEIIYPSVDTMKLAIGVWSAANQETWRKLIETQFIKFNPIWNVDAYEKETYGRGYTDEISYDSTNERTLNRTDERTVDLTDERTVDLTDERTVDLTDERTVDLTDEETRSYADTKSVKGFNSNTWAESEKTDYSGTDTFEHDGTDTVEHDGTETIEHDGTETIEHDGTDTVEYTGTDTMEHTGKDTHTGREDSGTERIRHGNIGVTASQDLIQKQRDIAEFNIIDYIADSFKKRFCLMVY